MKLQVKHVKDHGIKSKERIILKALDDIDVGNYLIADNTYYGNGEVSSKVRHTFWMPDKQVSKGDLVVVYTKNGKESTKQNESNRTHFFYWGLKRTIWNQEEDAAVIFNISDWSSKQV